MQRRDRLVAVLAFALLSAVGCVPAHQAVPPQPVPYNPAGRTAFTIDYGTCLYCGICIEECPFDALAWDDRLVPAPSARFSLQVSPDAP